MPGTTTDGLGLYPHYTTQFSTNVEVLLQQQGSKLRGKTMEGFHTGKMASPINQVGAVSMKPVTTRFEPKQRTDSDLKRRWVFPSDFDLDQLIDSFDELKTIVDPKSAYAQNAANAAGRQWDDVMLAAVAATAYLGQDANGLTTESFDTASYQIADTFGSGATASGLTVAKLIELKRLMRKYHNDLDSDSPTIVVGSQQESDLLNQVQVTSTEFNDRPVLVNGKLTRFLGFDFVCMERVPETTASTTRGVVAWVKSGMYLGIWKETMNDISIRKDLRGHPFDLYTMMSCGASRQQPGKVFRVLCADTTGADITP